MSTYPARWRRVGAGVAAAGLLLVGAVPAGAADVAFSLQEPKVREIAGLTHDTHDQRYWMVGTGGGQLTAHAINDSGALIGSTSSTDYTQNVTALAWNDRRLYLGDVGGSRRQVTIWSMYGPVPNTLINRAERMRLRYPDGAHAANAIFVTAEGRIHVVTFSARGGGIYAAPADARFGPEQFYDLERVGDAPPNIHDAAQLADGRVAMRSVTEAFTLEAGTWRVLAREPIAEQPRGGSLAESIDGRTLLASGMSAQTPVQRIAVPGGVTEERVTASAAPASPKPDDDRATWVTGLLGGGNLLAVGAGLAVAVLAGVIVVVRR